MQQHGLSSLARPIAAAASHDSGAQSIPANRDWCFLVKQRFDGPGAGQTMHFYLDSFAEALGVATDCTEGWQRGAIYAVLSRSSESGQRIQAVHEAYLLTSFGFLCCLESGLQLLDPHEGPWSSEWGYARRRVYDAIG